VEEDRAKREADDHHAGHAAEREEHHPEENQEGDVEIDREPEQGAQPP
jgi:hypothetical protein